jgi:deoxyribonuclease-4
MGVVGAHVSAAGGVRTPRSTPVIGRAFALFTKNQKQWQAASTEASIAALNKPGCRRHCPRHVLPPTAI